MKAHPVSKDALRILLRLNNSNIPIKKKEITIFVEHAHPKTHYTLMNMRELLLIKNSDKKGFYEITELGRKYIKLINGDGFLMELIR